jgi:hypothetical protein
MPRSTLPLGGAHGLLMAFGFLGTLVSLERAVALGRPWGYLAPLGAATGAIALLGGAPILGTWLFGASGVAFVAVYGAFLRIERSIHGAVQATGAVAWLGGAVLLVAGLSIAQVVPWLAAFLVLTILGERLELSRVTLPPPSARRVFVAAGLVLSAGVVLSAIVGDLGVRLAGVGLIGLALWLGRYDIARRTIRARGLTRFIAASLLPGYLWLAVAGTIWLVLGLPGGGPAYDAGLHALFLGFVMSMVFGHAPVILPAVLRLPLPYRSRFYLHLALLHAGLVLRIGGDALGAQGAWQLGGILNVTALLVFLGSSAAALGGELWHGRHRQARLAGQDPDASRPALIETGTR